MYDKPSYFERFQALSTLRHTEGSIKKILQDGKKNTLSGHKSYEKKGVRNIEGTMGSQDGLLSAARIHPWVFFAEVEPRGYLATSLIIDGVFVTTTVIGECLLASLRH